jgi:hypothetical protein
MTTTAETKNTIPAEVIERLRADRIAREKEAEQEGLYVGWQWAATKASNTELCRLDRWMKENRELDINSDEISEAITEGEYNLWDDTAASDEEKQESEFLLGFIQGASDCFAKVKQSKRYWEDDPSE